MRILIDECLPRELAAELIGHEVRTVPQEGWAGLKNGRLLKTISGSFEVFITMKKPAIVGFGLFFICTVISQGPSSVQAL